MAKALELTWDKLNGEERETVIASVGIGRNRIKLLHVLDFRSDSVGSSYRVVSHERDATQVIQRCGTFAEAMRLFNAHPNNEE